MATLRHGGLNSGRTLASLSLTPGVQPLAGGVHEQREAEGRDTERVDDDERDPQRVGPGLVGHRRVANRARRS